MTNSTKTLNFFCQLWNRPHLGGGNGHNSCVTNSIPNCGQFHKKFWVWLIPQTFLSVTNSTLVIMSISTPVIVTYSTKTIVTNSIFPKILFLTSDAQFQTTRTHCHFFCPLHIWCLAIASCLSIQWCELEADQ